jgi:hypothetical protein
LLACMHASVPMQVSHRACAPPIHPPSCMILIRCTNRMPTAQTRVLGAHLRAMPAFCTGRSLEQRHAMDARDGARSPQEEDRTVDRDMAGGFRGWLWGAMPRG